jgi:hypothetical protein
MKQQTHNNKEGKDMRIKTTETKVYTWDELTDEQKEKALSKLYDLNTGYEWWQSVYEDAEDVGIKITSFDLDRNRHAEGKFTMNATDVAKAIVEDHGPDCETYKTAREFLNAVTPMIDFRDNFADDDNTTEEEYKTFDDNTDKIEELEEEFLKSILEDYSIMLQKEYEYLSSEEAIVETIKANEYEFDENGNIA